MSEKRNQFLNNIIFIEESLNNKEKSKHIYDKLVEEGKIDFAYGTFCEYVDRYNLRVKEEPEDNGNVQFNLIRDEVEEYLQKGYTRKSIYKKFHEENRYTLSFANFRRTVKEEFGIKYSRKNMKKGQTTIEFEKYIDKMKSILSEGMYISRSSLYKRLVAEDNFQVKYPRFTTLIKQYGIDDIIQKMKNEEIIDGQSPISKKEIQIPKKTENSTLPVKQEDNLPEKPETSSAKKITTSLGAKKDIDLNKIKKEIII